jgi:Fe-S oxidoreductase
VRKIVASCPHCFNTLANEYGDFGGNYEVMHHTELLAELVDEGRLQPAANGKSIMLDDGVRAVGSGMRVADALTPLE